MDISPLFPIFPLFIISFYVVQSKRSLLLWWGISLLVSGSFVILLGIMGKFVGIDYLLAEYWVQGLPSQFSTWIAPFLEKVWGAVLETCTNKVLYIGILTMLFGTCLMGIIKFRFLYHYWTGRNN